MNTIIIKGRLTRDPEVRETQNGYTLCSISVAVDRRVAKGQEKQADFFNCVFWNKVADVVSKYFKKGQEILVVGHMQSRRWQDKEGNDRLSWEIQGDQVEFCGPSNNANGGKNNGNRNQYNNGGGQRQNSAIPGGNANGWNSASPAMDDIPEDLPF